MGDRRGAGKARKRGRDLLSGGCIRFRGPVLDGMEVDDKRVRLVPVERVDLGHVDSGCVCVRVCV